MEFGDMTKDELEAFGRTVGIELDRRLTKAVLIEQLNEHIENAEAELSDELSDPVYLDAEIEEEDFLMADEDFTRGEDHPLMPKEMPVIEEEPVDPMIAIQEEADARRHMTNTKEMVIQAQQVYDSHKQMRIDCEVAEVESAEALDVAKDVALKAELHWKKLAEKL
jgi:hypothetical protein